MFVVWATVIVVTEKKAPHYAVEPNKLISYPTIISETTLMLLINRHVLRRRIVNDLMERRHASLRLRQIPFGYLQLPLQLIFLLF